MRTSHLVLAGRYEIEDLIGWGGMGQVFRGTDRVLGRTVAVKVLSPRHAADRGFLARFQEEARAAARLDHPGVVQVFDAGSDGDAHFIVMEHVRGRTLDVILREEGPLPPAEAVRFAAELCRALDFAHRHGVVHCDAKPGNVMLTGEGRVKLMDFGIARAADDPEQTAAILGTASYLSPEQARGDPVDPRSDVYSLGVVLYEMLTGQAPLTGRSAAEVAAKHLTEMPAPPGRVAPWVRAGLDAVVMRALSKHPGNRYARAEELRGDLERAVLGRSVTATPVLVEEPEPEVGPPRPRRSHALLAGEVSVVVLVLLVLFLGRLFEGGPPAGSPSIGGVGPVDPKITGEPTLAPPRASPPVATAVAPTPSPEATPSPEESPTESPSSSPSPSSSTPPTLPIPTPTIPAPG